MVAGFGHGPVAPVDQESAVEDVMLCGHGAAPFNPSKVHYAMSPPTGDRRTCDLAAGLGPCSERHR